jgi:AICAR transformylase/IMP cyclohydrolase PurH
MVAGCRRQRMMAIRKVVRSLGAGKLQLRYGCNTHQKHAIVPIDSTSAPVRVLNGTPGFINYPDALNA